MFDWQTRIILSLLASFMLNLSFKRIHSCWCPRETLKCPNFIFFFHFPFSLEMITWSHDRSSKNPPGHQQQRQQERHHRGGGKQASFRRGDHRRAGARRVLDERRRGEDGCSTRGPGTQSGPPQQFLRPPEVWRMSDCLKIKVSSASQQKHWKEQFSSSAKSIFYNKNY